jgi:hypothetical protein
MNRLNPADAAGVPGHAILHFVGDDDDPWAIVAALLDALPRGSYLALSHLNGGVARKM